MNGDIGRPNVWLWLTIPVAALLAMASGGGLLISGLYRDVPYFAAQAVGQDLISFSVVLPLLIVSAVLTSRGSPGAKLIWLGGLTYLVYTYVIAAFDVRFNSLFLVYVALLGCSVYALIGGMVTTNMAQIKACFTQKAPAKAISIYLGVLAVLFYFLWLSEVVPALLRGEIPKSVQDNGTPTNSVHVLDMAWVLPALLITSVSLWRKRALGYTLAGVLLSYCVLLTLAILSMAVFMIRGGHLVAIAQLGIFGALFALSLGMLIWYMRGLKSLST
jgi:hypothetical protein